MIPIKLTLNPPEYNQLRGYAQFNRFSQGFHLYNPESIS